MSPITSGRFTSIPSVARSFNWSSSVISFSLSFRFICLYNMPLVLKNFLSWSPLIVYHSFNSSYVGFSSLIARSSNSTLCASSHFNAFSVYEYFHNRFSFSIFAYFSQYIISVSYHSSNVLFLLHYALLLLQSCLPLLLIQATSLLFHIFLFLFHALLLLTLPLCKSYPSLYT